MLQTFNSKPDQVFMQFRMVRVNGMCTFDGLQHQQKFAYNKKKTRKPRQFKKLIYRVKDAKDTLLFYFLSWAKPFLSPDTTIL